MECPRCHTAMETQTLDGRLGKAMEVDVCRGCRLFWFDAHESPGLSAGSTLLLFRLIGECGTQVSFQPGDLAKCPRCHARLYLAHDMQRATRFTYLTCPNGHGRLTTFVDFLKEKDFIRPLTPQQLEELRKGIQTVNCANCGAPVDLVRSASCGHCGSPLSMLDLKQAAALIEQLQRADARTGEPIDPALPLELARARRDVEQAFAAMEHEQRWMADARSFGLVGAGLNLVVRWLKRNS